MDTLTFLMLMMLVVLVVIVIQLRRGAGGGGKCSCPVDQKWLDEFNKFADALYTWQGEVQIWIDAYDKCLAEKCTDVAAAVEPPRPPPCKFGSC